MSTKAKSNYSRCVSKEYADQLLAAVLRTYGDCWSAHLNEPEYMSGPGKAMLETRTPLSQLSERRLDHYIDGFISGWTAARS